MFFCFICIFYIPFVIVRVDNTRGTRLCRDFGPRMTRKENHRHTGEGRYPLLYSDEYPNSPNKLLYKSFHSGFLFGRGNYIKKLLKSNSIYYAACFISDLIRLIYLRNSSIATNVLSCFWADQHSHRSFVTPIEGGDRGYENLQHQNVNNVRIWLATLTLYRPHSCLR